MATDVETLAVCMKTSLVEEMWNEDHSLVQLPFDDAKYSNKNKLKVFPTSCGTIVHGLFISCHHVDVACVCCAVPGWIFQVHRWSPLV